MRRSLSPWLARSIRERREARGLSQQDLARGTNLHRTYISLVERAVRNISVDALSVIADGLDLRPSQLLHYAERLRAMRARLSESSARPRARPVAPAERFGSSWCSGAPSHRTVEPRTDEEYQVAKQVAREQK